MVIWKKHFLKIFLIIALIAAGVLCVYSVWNYSRENLNTENGLNQRGFSQGQRNEHPGNIEQRPGGQFQNRDNGMQQGNAPGSNQGRRKGGGNGNMLGSFSNDAAKYVPQLVGYLILFLGAFIFTYFYLTKKHSKIDTGNMKIIIFILLGTGLFLRIYASTLMSGHPFDISTFKNWAAADAKNLFQVYSTGRPSDYPPLYMYVLYLIGKIGAISYMAPYFTILLKLPSMLADIATSYLLYKLAKKYLALEMSVFLSAFYIFNPAIFINSTFWGQVDSFFTLFVVSAVILLSENKIGLSSMLFTCAVLMKPQGIIFLPILFFELVRQRSLRSFLKAAAFALAAGLIIVLPFAFNKGPTWILNLYSSTLGEYKYASMNAFNFFSLLGANYADDKSTLLVFSYYIWGMVAIVLVTLLSWLVYIKGQSRIFAPAVALFIIAGVFTFSSRMHERYLFPAVALAILAFIYIKDRRLLFLAGGFSLTVYINTHYVLYETAIGAKSIEFDPILMLTSLANVLLFGYLAKVLFGIVVKKKVLHFDESAT